MWLGKEGGGVCYNVDSHLLLGEDLLLSRVESLNMDTIKSGHLI